MRSDFIVTCAVLEELDLGVCKVPATTRVHDYDDRGDWSILSCEAHVPLARGWVRQRTGGYFVGESQWPKRSQGVSK